jgi:hypothetical protein
MGTNSMSTIGIFALIRGSSPLCPFAVKESARSFPRADHLSPQQLFESNDSSGTGTQPPEEANETRHCYSFPFNTVRKNAQLRTKKREDSTLKALHLAFSAFLNRRRNCAQRGGQTKHDEREHTLGTDIAD